MKRSWGCEVTNLSLLVAIGVDREGNRSMLGVAEGAKEDKAGWLGFLKHLKGRGLTRVRLFISDKCLGLVESLGEVYPAAGWQRCVAHFYRNVFTLVPKGKVREVAAMLKAIHAQEELPAAMERIAAVAAKLEAMKLKKAAALVRASAGETLSYMSFPVEYWWRIRTNNPLERILREVRRRTWVVSCFPDGESALMLVAARLRHIASTRWVTKKYLNIERLNETKLEEGVTA